MTTPLIAHAAYTESLRSMIEACGLPTSDLHDDPNLFWLVAKHETEMIGTVALQRRDDTALLRSLAVGADHRNRGVGSALVADAEALAKRQRIHTLYLLTEGAGAYFAGLGYRGVARACVPESLRALPQFRGLCPDSASCYRKQLVADGYRALHAGPMRHQ